MRRQGLDQRQLDRFDVAIEIDPVIGEPGLGTIGNRWVILDLGREVRVVHDRHVEGVFPRDSWLRLLAAAGFEARIVHDPWGRDLFVCRRV